jgi:predicted ribosome quality control (RQC) complex YloA/Tae2 family protein
MMIFESLGRSANLLLVGDDFGVLWAGRTLGGPTRTGQPGEIWNPPPPRAEPFSAPPAPPDPEGTLREGLLERGRASALKELDKRERALVRRREAVREDLRGGGDPASLSLMGQILLASGDLTRRGDALREVQDFGQDPPRSISVPLEPALSVKENARRLFKKARKAKVREVEAVRVLAGIEESILATRGDREFLASSQRMEDFFGGGTAPRTPAKQPRRDLPPDVCRVPLPDGFSGYAGKSATGNQTVSFRIGKGGDFWFHAADYPGSHVVVKNPGRLASLPGVVEMAAALYAAAHSQAPPGNRLAVTSALCKQLRPAPGHPGQVFLSGGRTLFVDLPGR